jgi:hypothetical protein
VASHLHLPFRHVNDFTAKFLTSRRRRALLPVQCFRLHYLSLHYWILLPASEIGHALYARKFKYSFTLCIIIAACSALSVPFTGRDASQGHSFVLLYLLSSEFLLYSRKFCVVTSVRRQSTRSKRNYNVDSIILQPTPTRKSNLTCRTKGSSRKPKCLPNCLLPLISVTPPSHCRFQPTRQIEIARRRRSTGPHPAPPSLAACIQPASKHSSPPDPQKLQEAATDRADSSHYDTMQRHDGPRLAKLHDPPHCTSSGSRRTCRALLASIVAQAGHRMVLCPPAETLGAAVLRRCGRFRCKCCKGLHAGVGARRGRAGCGLVLVP